jgi:2C-methyl-D-erythritol 2,4-cyclodiphosphate synthase
MEVNLAKLLDTDVFKINVKGKSMDQIGEIGEGMASAVMTTVSISHA